MEELKQTDLDQIVASVLSAGGVDFSNYAVASLRRRVLRLTEFKVTGGQGVLFKDTTQGS